MQRNLRSVWFNSNPAHVNIVQNVAAVVIESRVQPFNQTRDAEFDSPLDSNVLAPPKSIPLLILKLTAFPILKRFLIGDKILCSEWELSIQ